MTGPETEFAPAKLNLWLHVCGRRADGYHLLDSLVVFADVGDRLTVQPADEVSLEVAGPLAGALAGLAAADNLVLKAAKGLADLCGARAGARLRLEKQLPAGAGLGGGSADAAAALRLLCRHWQVDPPAEDLKALALSLGADVPVCLFGRPARVGGIGEEIAPAEIAIEKIWAVLVHTGAALSTPDVFRELTEEERNKEPLRAGRPLSGDDDLWELLSEARNDMEAAACRLQPQIVEALEALRAAGECRLARMSGSGAACFGLFTDEDSALTAANGLKRAGYPWVKCARILKGSG